MSIVFPLLFNTHTAPIQVSLVLHMRVIELPALVTSSGRQPVLTLHNIAR
jgi:hypothetical protein